MFCVSSCHQPKGLRESLHLKDIDVCFPKCHSPNACAEWSCLDSDNFILFLFPPLGAVSTLDTSLAAEMVAEGFINGIFTMPFKCQ